MKTLRAVVEETGLWSTPESFLCFAFGFDFPPVSEPILEVSFGVQVDFEPGSNSTGSFNSMARIYLCFDAHINKICLTS